MSWARSLWIVLMAAAFGQATISADLLLGITKPQAGTNPINVELEQPAYQLFVWHIIGLMVLAILIATLKKDPWALLGISISCVLIAGYFSVLLAEAEKTAWPWIAGGSIICAAFIVASERFGVFSKKKVPSHVPTGRPVDHSRDQLL